MTRGSARPRWRGTGRRPTTRPSSSSPPTWATSSPPSTSPPRPGAAWACRPPVTASLCPWTACCSSRHRWTRSPSMPRRARPGSRPAAAGVRCSRPPRSTAWRRSSARRWTIGAVGYTLGGGLGWLARRYGPSCDAVRSFEVVTPDGELVCASATSTPRCSTPCAAAAAAASASSPRWRSQLFPVTTVYGGEPHVPGRRLPPRC